MRNIYILGFGALEWWGFLALAHSAPPPLDPPLLLFLIMKSTKSVNASLLQHLINELALKSVSYNMWFMEHIQWFIYCFKMLNYFTRNDFHDCFYNERHKVVGE